MKKVLAALIVSPLVGFSAAALVFLLFKLLAKDPRLYQAPKGRLRRRSTFARC